MNNNEISEIYSNWFNELEKVQPKAAKQSDKYAILFKPELFDNLQFQTLINLFEFAYSKQDKLLIDIVAYVISQSIYIIDEIDDKYYINRSNRTLEINLIKSILAVMSDNKYAKQSINIRKLISYRPKVLPYANFEIKDEYIHNDKYDQYRPIPVPYCVIPYSQKSIKHNEFSGCSSLSSVILPSSITAIGSGAFDHCSNLSSIIIPESVKRISDSTFYKCKNLKTVILPESVKYIGKYAFYMCQNLKTIVLPKHIKHISDYAFYGCPLSEDIKQEILKINPKAFDNPYSKCPESFN